MIISVDEAKEQLGVEHDNDDMLIEGFVLAALGIVEHELQRDIYLTKSDIPESDINAISFYDLKETKKSVLKIAVKLVLATLYLHRESALEIDLSDNPAFKACLSGFTGVYLG
jgi:hypothetical protein